MTTFSSDELSVTVYVSVSSRMLSSTTVTLWHSSRPPSPGVNVRLMEKTLKSAATGEMGGGCNGTK